jgi:hypothetical protein
MDSHGPYIFLLSLLFNVTLTASTHDVIITMNGKAPGYLLWPWRGFGRSYTGMVMGVCSVIM